MSAQPGQSGLPRESLCLLLNREGPEKWNIIVEQFILVRKRHNESSNSRLGHNGLSSWSPIKPSHVSTSNKCLTRKLKWSLSPPVSPDSLERLLVDCSTWSVKPKNAHSSYSRKTKFKPTKFWLTIKNGYENIEIEVQNLRNLRPTSNSTISLTFLSLPSHIGFITTRWSLFSVKVAE